jgi:dynein heavy chain
LTPRFMRHFHVFNMPDTNEDTCRKIFSAIIESFLAQNHFSEAVRRLGDTSVNATIALYTEIQQQLLPIPAKFHYTFNLRDIAKVFQGILCINSQSVSDGDVFTYLWVHEASRVFNDRLINLEDREKFRNIIMDLLNIKFKPKTKPTKETLFEGESSVMFSKILRLDSEPEMQHYELIDEAMKKKLLRTLDDKIMDYNLAKSSSKLDLVFFEDAVNHIARISRILMQPRGNAMLIGVSGCGK